jgi:hypothetical protein
MSKTISLEIPEDEVPSFESALDRALAALRQANSEASDEREERISNLRAETHVLMEQIRAELHVEETI